MTLEDTPGTIYPGLFYDDPLAAIDWLCRAFGFESRLVVPGGEGEVAHAELTLGNGCVMLGSANPGNGWLSPRSLAGVNQSVSIYLPDVDTVFAQAVAAGANVIVPLADTDYGSRGFVVTDPEGHFWNFGTYRPPTGPEFREMNETEESVVTETFPATVTAYLCVAGAADAIDFYTRAFGAVERYRIDTDGRIGHAEIVIGNTVLMFSDEHPEVGVLAPPTVGGSTVSFVLDIPDLDATWQRALDAGASVQRPIADQPYGRGGWITDPFGYRWSVMTSNPDFDPEAMK